MPHPFCPLLVLALKPSRSFHHRKTFRNQEGGAKYPQLPGHGCFGLSTDRPRKPHLGFPAYIQVSINTDTYISERESTLRSPALTQHQRFHPRSPSPRVHRRPPPGFILDPPLHQGSSSSRPPQLIYSFTPQLWTSLTPSVHYWLIYFFNPRKQKVISKLLARVPITYCFSPPLNWIIGSTYMTKTSALS